RCLPNNTREILHATWDTPVASRVPFGVIKSWSFVGADYALFEKINPDFKSNPFIRNSRFSTAIPYIYADLFNLYGTEVPAGHEICISGYESHVKCGSVTSSDSRAKLKSFRPGSNRDLFYHMIVASIKGPLSDMDRGGTVFSVETGDNLHLIVHGILTAFRYFGSQDTSIITMYINR
ncbi:12567_t:CDS:2, partial [Gigaspora margarita]